MTDETSNNFSPLTHTEGYTNNTYNRLYFGVKSAPGLFQQLVTDAMLSGLHKVVSYVDDIIMVGKSEHRENVTTVLKRV